MQPDPPPPSPHPRKWRLRHSSRGSIFSPLRFMSPQRYVNSRCSPVKGLDFCYMENFAGVSATAPLSL